MKRNAFSAKRLVLNAVLVGLYVVLSFWKIPIGNLLRVNFASFAVVLCAVAFSPVDALLVGFLGEFLGQILGPYGLTPTTLLWTLPEAVRGLLLGCSMLLLAKKNLTPGVLYKSKSIAVFLAVCIVVGIVAALLNTFALYVDSKMFGYYNEYMVFGILFVRLGLACVMSALFGYISLPVVSALERNRFI